MLDALPELVLGALHELVGDLLFVSLPIVLRHLNLIMMAGRDGWMNRRSLSLIGLAALEAVVDGLAVEGGHHVALPHAVRWLLR